MLESARRTILMLRLQRPAIVSLCAILALVAVLLSSPRVIAFNKAVSGSDDGTDGDYDGSG